MANLIFIVPSTGSPTAAEAAIKTLLEGDGHTVTYGDHATTTPHTLTSGYDCVVISSGASSYIGADTQNSFLPHVWLRGASASDEGWCDSTATVTSQTQIIITNDAHPLAAGLANGTHTIIGSGVVTFRRFATLDAAPVVIATTTAGDPCLIGIEEGAVCAAVGGGAMMAVGRRVFLPFSPATTLNSNGQALLFAAVDWALATPNLWTHYCALVGARNSTDNRAAALRLGSLDVANGVRVAVAWETDVALTFDPLRFDLCYIAGSTTTASTIGDVTALDLPVFFARSEAAITPDSLVELHNVGAAATQITIVDIGHYITAPLSLGALTVTSSQTRSYWNTLGGGSALAHTGTSTQHALSVFEAGANDGDGIPCLQRRAVWCFRNFDPLDSTGEGIWDRTVEWVLGLDSMGAIDGTAAITLDDATAEGAAGVAVAGTSAATSEDAGASGAAGVGVSGTAAAQTDDASASGSGGSGLSGSAATTLDDASASGAGAGGELPQIAGAGSVTLEDASATGAGLVAITGSGETTTEGATAGNGPGKVVRVSGAYPDPTVYRGQYAPSARYIGVSYQ